MTLPETDEQNGSNDPSRYIIEIDCDQQACAQLLYDYLEQMLSDLAGVNLLSMRREQRH